MVPIRNLYHLLCYAWECPRGASDVDVASIVGDRIEDLLASMLAQAIDDLHRRGLDRSYVVEAEDLRAPRGRLDVSATIGRCLERTTRVACSFDELSYDIPQNRALKAAGLRLLQQRLTSSTETRLRAALSRVPATRMPLDRQLLERATLHRHNARYRFALHVCGLVLDASIPDESGRGHRMVDVRRDDQMMGLIFERFVRNFLKLEQSAFRVGRESPRWATTPDTGNILVPGMQTDVSLERGEARFVIETKAVGGPLRPGRDGRRRLREGHLYQVFAYLKSLRAMGRAQRAAVLLYVEDQDRFDTRFGLDGERVRALTVDLKQPWPGIKNDLVRLVGELADGAYT